jgi:MinD-like ATPase involved in chromosome partitioning or flagellar assembly
VHTDEDDELYADLEFDDELDDQPDHEGRVQRGSDTLRDTGHTQVRNSLFEDFTYDPDDELDLDGPYSDDPYSDESHPADPYSREPYPDEGTGPSAGPVVSRQWPIGTQVRPADGGPVSGDEPESDGDGPVQRERDRPGGEAHPALDQPSQHLAGGHDQGRDDHDHDEPGGMHDERGPEPDTAAAVASGGGRRDDPASTAPRSRAVAAAESRSAGRWIEPGAVAAQQAQRARNGELTGPDGELASARLLRQSRRPPRSGWRRALYVISGRTVNLGEGRADMNERELITRINRPLHGCYKIAMLSLKGGVGKTTVTATLGATFASLRGDRVIAVDANPDRGTLSQKIPLETSATVRHLLRDAQRVRRYTDVRAYTSQGPSRLEVLASEQDPAVSEAFSEAEYRRTVNLLEHFYNVVLTDCGTGLMHSAMYGVLGLADALVIVSSGSIDGARSASATMDWLDAHGHGDLVANSVAVINSVRRNSGGVDLDRVAEHFAARCRKVIRVPFDSHLEEGAEIDLDRLSPHTRAALLELAAAVADNFPSNEP